MLCENPAFFVGQALSGQRGKTYGVAVREGVACGVSAVSVPGALVLVGGRVAVGVTMLTGMVSSW